MKFPDITIPVNQILLLIPTVALTGLNATAADNDISCSLVRGEVVCSSAPGSANGGNEHSCNVRSAQRALNKQGINVGAIDGVWGKSTAGGVKRFQKKSNIETTGQLDRATCTALNVGKSCEDILDEWTTNDMDRISAFWGRTREDAVRMGIKPPAVIPPKGCHLRLDAEGSKVTPYCDGKALSKDSCRNPFGVDPFS